MSCGKCGKAMKLCPVSFGLALGLTAAIAMIIWSVWVMEFGMPAEMAGRIMPPATFGGIAIRAGWGLLKGFLFGFVLALLYDLISCCCKARCCKPNGAGSCGCGNPSCNCNGGSKPKAAQ